MPDSYFRESNKDLALELRIKNRGLLGGVHEFYFVLTPPAATCVTEGGVCWLRFIPYLHEELACPEPFISKVTSVDTEHSLLFS